MSLFSKKRMKAEVSYLTLEVMYEYAGNNPQCTVAEALAAGVTACGVDFRELTDEDAARLVNRVAQLQEADAAASAPKEPGGEPAPSKEKVGVGTDYLGSVGKMPMDLKCLYATGFDWDRAKFLFSRLDKEDCDTVVTAALETKWKELKTIFESVIVGMGGDLTGEKDGVDASSQEGLDALRHLGF
jgi:hypothetical protein